MSVLEFVIEAVFALPGAIFEGIFDIFTSAKVKEARRRTVTSVSLANLYTILYRGFGGSVMHAFQPNSFYPPHVSM